MVGNERVAALHDRYGEPQLAAIRRLTDEQAVQVLAYLSATSEKWFTEAMEAAGVEVNW